MRTKKIISLLLSMLMLAGIGAVGAHAQPAAAEGIQTQAAAQVGWPTMVEIFQRADLASSWDKAVVAWEMFTSTTDSNDKSNNDGYYNQRTADKTKIEWTVTAYRTVNGIVEPYTLTVYETPTAAVNKAMKIYKLQTSSTQEQLYIEQGTAKYYGRLDVTCTVTAKQTNGVTAGGTNVDVVRTSTNTVEVILKDQSTFIKTLDKAREILAKERRYSEAYIEELEAVVAGAELILGGQPTQTTIDSVLKDLEAVIDRAPENYELFKTLTFLNFIAVPIFWISDFISGIQEFINENTVIISAVIRVITAIFKTFGYLIPLITSFFGMFGI